MLWITASFLLPMLEFPEILASPFSVVTLFEQGLELQENRLG